MRLAAIDIGTNSVLLTVVERAADGGWLTLIDECIITRLGRGVDASGRLDPAAIARTLEALRSYQDRIAQLGVGRLAVVGTSAMRDAANGAAFSVPASRLLGVPIDTISGEHEAALVVGGVRSSHGPLGPGTVVFDVGGGSTELVAVGDGGRVDGRVSLDIGTVRLTERCITADPPSELELAQAADHIRAALATLGAAFAQGATRLIGVAGTVTTLAAIELELGEYDSARVNAARLTRGDVAALLGRLAALPLSRRALTVGLQPQRADVIVCGALLVGEVMDALSVTTLEVCDRGVRWGLLEQLAE